MQVTVNKASSKAQEPTMEEWGAAAEFKLTLQIPEGFNATQTELILAIDYLGG